MLANVSLISKNDDDNLQVDNNSEYMNNLKRFPHHQIPMPTFGFPPLSASNAPDDSQFATIMRQAGMPLALPFGLLPYPQFPQQYQPERTYIKEKGSLRRGKWTVIIFFN